MPTDDESLLPPAPPLAPPPVSRFVPTLTEVISPGDAAPAPAEPAAEPQPDAVPVTAAAPVSAQAVELAVDALLARLAPELDRLVAEAVGRVLHEHMLGFNGRLQKAVGDVVREAVTKAVAEGGNS